MQTAARRRLSQAEAARRISSLIEEQMDHLGLSEDEKCERVRKFAEGVKNDLGARPKQSKSRANAGR